MGEPARLRHPLGAHARTHTHKHTRHERHTQAASTACSPPHTHKAHTPTHPLHACNPPYTQRACKQPATLPHVHTHTHTRQSANLRVHPTPYSLQTHGAAHTAPTPPPLNRGDTHTQCANTYTQHKHTQHSLQTSALTHTRTPTSPCTSICRACKHPNSHTHTLEACKQTADPHTLWAHEACSPTNLHTHTHTPHVCTPPMQTQPAATCKHTS